MKSRQFTALAVLLFLVAVSISQLHADAKATPDVLTTLVYGVSDLPVFSKSQEGETKFDSKVLVALLSKSVDLAEDSSIKGVNSDGSIALVVRATSENHAAIREVLDGLRKK